MTIRVVNRRTWVPDGTEAVYCGRPSPLGNPFHIGRDGTREEVIAQYEAWLLREYCDPGSEARLAYYDLLVKATRGDLTLVCHCAPLACHADVIARHLREALETSS